MITNILDFYYHINGTKNNLGILDEYAANVNLLGWMKGERMVNVFFVFVNYIVMEKSQIIYTKYHKLTGKPFPRPGKGVQRNYYLNSS